MPRVRPLTAAQAKRQAYQKRTTELAKGLGAAKTYQGLDNDGVGAELGLSRIAAARLLKGEGDVRMTVTGFWAALDLAGLEIRQKSIQLDL